MSKPRVMAEWVSRLATIVILIVVLMLQVVILVAA